MIANVAYSKITYSIVIPRGERNFDFYKQELIETHPGCRRSSWYQPHPYQ